MSESDRYWTAGNWHVSEGREDEFIERWTAFMTWTDAAVGGFLSARLVRDTADPAHFVSFASWRDPEAIGTWQRKPDFHELFGECRALCDGVDAGGYVLAADVRPRP
ncbi:Antibiotic biosynthesis monooxygenase [Actinobacteria bacterium OV450]|nr:Antibiotic biosynthesis monooxygenase [Actinobacteria bacterium OV450]